MILGSADTLPGEPGLDHPPWENEGKNSLGGNLCEGRSVQANQFISAWQLRWEKLRLRLTAPTAGLGQREPQEALSYTTAASRRVHRGFKGKWPVEKEK